MGLKCWLGRLLAGSMRSPLGLQHSCTAAGGGMRSRWARSISLCTKMSARAIRTLFRLCLRQAAELERQGMAQLEFRKPIDKQAWLLGKSSLRWCSPSPAYNVDAFRSLLPWCVSEGAEVRGVFTPAEVRELIRHHFRHPAPVETEAEYVDRAITTLRVLAEQIYLAQCSSVCQTEGVVVEVTSAWMGKGSDVDPMYEEGDIEKSHFTYRVRVANLGDTTVQVLARHWVVTDTKGGVSEIRKWSPAVVGMRPILEKGAVFEYYSRTDIETREGTMEGEFQVGELDMEARRRDPVRLFEAQIAPFKLKLPPGQ